MKDLSDGRHFMFDIETLATGTNAIVASVGLVIFNREKELFTDSYNLDIDEQISIGRKFDVDALLFWTRQPEAVFKKTFNTKDPWDIESFFDEILKNLFAHGIVNGDYGHADNPPVSVWSHGLDFDIPILENLYQDARSIWTEFEIPPRKLWPHNVGRCFRTYSKMTGCQSLVVKDISKTHDALEDAKWQAECLRTYWKGNIYL